MPVQLEDGFKFGSFGIMVTLNPPFLPDGDTVRGHDKRRFQVKIHDPKSDHTPAHRVETPVSDGEVHSKSHTR